MIGTQKNNFPSTYANFETQQLIEAFATGPSRLRLAIADLTGVDLRKQPQPNKWSIKEIAIHVGDSEIFGSTRIRHTYAAPGSAFAFYDQDVFAAEFNYQEFSAEALEHSLRVFEELRQTTTPIFKRANGDDWEKWGLHAELGALTLRQLLELYADHSERHIGQILDLRRTINKPIELPLLLPLRLY